MNYNEALNYIHSLGFFSKPAGLCRIKAVLEKLSNPQKSFKAIHIAGTNGKGSTSAMLSEIFKTSGYKTAFFTSPFIIDFRERIQINGEYISENDLARLTEKVKATEIELTEFEFVTAIAFLYFAEQRVDIAVVETGLGGRLDATNTLTNVLASVITKIGLDHTAILGSTIEEITAEKCGIIKNDNVITSVNQEKAAISVIEKHTKKLIIPKADELKVLKSDLSGNVFFYKGKKYETSLLGDYQIENALTVIETVAACGIDVSYEDVVKGIKNARFPARMESFKNGRIILDGAHNPDGGVALLKEIEKLNEPLTAIIGMMRDKDVGEFLSLLLPNFKNVITVKATETKRAMTDEELRSEAEKYNLHSVAAGDFVEALKLAESYGNRVFIFGSLYLASAIRPLLEEK